MQCLYEWSMRPTASSDEILTRNLKQTSFQDLDTFYIKSVFNNVITRVDEIDPLISKSAPEWPLEQISAIDKTILRLAIFELLFSTKIFISDKQKELIVPHKVAIDEAVEIAKTFGGDNSSKFVNGVLGTVYRQSDIYNPDEDKAPPKKIKVESQHDQKTSST